MSTRIGLRRFVPHLLVFSALATVLWWLGLWLFPPFRVLFLLHGAPEWVLWSFFASDALLLVLLPLFVAHLMIRSSTAAWPLLCVYCGSVIYATLLTLSLCAWSRSAWLGAVAMSLQSALIITLVFAMRPQASSRD